VNLVTNGDFATDASGWTMLDTVSGDTWVAANYSGTVGYPAGSVQLLRTYGGASTTGHRYYQFIPIDPNTNYHVRAQWKGDLAVGATGSGVAEMYIGFTADANASEPSWSSILRYRKSWDGINNVNVAASGAWNWEDVTTSPNGTVTQPFRSQGSHHYMVVAFNLRGDVMTPLIAEPYIYIDNIVVVACNQWLTGDANMDCKIDFADVAAVTNQWLMCNLDPASSCW